MHWFAIALITIASLLGKISSQNRTTGFLPECRPGTHLGATEGECVPCQSGVNFAATYNRDLICTSCTACHSDERVASQCSASSDTVCQCREGWFRQVDGRCALQEDYIQPKSAPAAPRPGRQYLRTRPWSATSTTIAGDARSETSGRRDAGQSSESRTRDTGYPETTPATPRITTAATEGTTALAAENDTDGEHEIEARGSSRPLTGAAEHSSNATEPGVWPTQKMTATSPSAGSVALTAQKEAPSTPPDVKHSAEAATQNNISFRSTITTLRPTYMNATHDAVESRDGAAESRTSGTPSSHDVETETSSSPAAATHEVETETSLSPAAVTRDARSPPEVTAGRTIEARISGGASLRRETTVASRNASAATTHRGIPTRPATPTTPRDERATNVSAQDPASSAAAGDSRGVSQYGTPTQADGAQHEGMTPTSAKEVAFKGDGPRTHQHEASGGLVPWKIATGVLGGIVLGFILFILIFGISRKLRSHLDPPHDQANSSALSSHGFGDYELPHRRS